MRTPVFEILLIDDNRGDALLAVRAFSESAPGVNMTVAQTGEDAMDILTRRGTHAGKRLPDLVLLDRSLPRMDGLDVLQAIRTDGALRHLPVIMMSGASDQDTVNRCYSAGANAYIAKPQDMASYRHAATRIEGFYLDLCRLPVESI